jgi:hypothetical protein
VPLGKVVVKAIEPSELAQVLGLVIVPAVKVGAIGLFTVLLVTSDAVQPKFVIEKLLYVPSSKSVKAKALLATVIVLDAAPVPV